MQAQLNHPHQGLVRMRQVVIHQDQNHQLSQCPEEVQMNVFQVTPQDQDHMTQGLFSASSNI